MNLLARQTIFLISLLMAFPMAVRGFNAAETYADSSVLSKGRWTRISVTRTGLHLITTSELRSMGFSNPANVRIHGYGGLRIPDHFTRSNYIDDLPEVNCEVTSRGIVFYALGVDTRVEAEGGNFIHTLNPYSNTGYYFLTESNTPAREMQSEGLAPDNNPTTTFIDGTRHETDLTSPAESGHLLLGEDFRLTRSRRFTFNLPGLVEGSNVWLRAGFFGKTTSAPAVFRLTANGTPLPENTGDRVAPTDDYGKECIITKTFTIDSSTLSLGIECSYSGSVSLIALDNISVCYNRALAMPASGTLHFTTSARSLLLAGATADTRVWDVTDPANIISVKTTPSAGGVAWSSEYNGQRSYAAWNPGATFQTPSRTGSVANQNLHGRSVPDMVILTHPSLASHSERIAAMHRDDPTAPLDVLVVTPQEVYNEFGSGTPDINAIRRMLKMFYDRGTSPDGHSLKYFLLMGGVTFDHRAVTPAIRNSNGTYLPTWQTDGSVSENTSYSSDDFYSFLEDNSGIRTDQDKLCIAVGRIPARNTTAAKIFTDRLISYVTNPISGEWRSRIVLLADDEDMAEHLDQTESLEQKMRSNHLGENLVYHKVYLDSDEKIGGVTVNARSKLHSLLNSGALWWNYIGHASLRELSGEGVMTLQDITSLYLRHPVFFYGATCSFLHWDGTELSGLEMLAMSESGGVIGGISAVRPVFITRNGYLSDAMGAELFARDDNGMVRPVAEAMRRAKNRVQDTNKLRYVFLGDPAMRLAVPHNMAVLNSVGDVDITTETDRDAIIPSLSPTLLKGSVTDPDGNIQSDFNGYVTLTLYDAERSFTTSGRKKNGGIEEKAIRNFDEQGERIYAGRAKVNAGLWETTVLLPTEIADNFRPATLLMYAETDDASGSGGGTSRSLYAYGLAQDAITDEEPPVIEQLVLNHESFKNGETVNASPMLIARVSDDNGFNLSSSGIGHMMSVRIDETMNLTDVSGSFILDNDGSPSGSINYRLPELTPGHHTAMLKVWDIAGNSASGTIEFFVDPNAAPKIFEMYSDANPAREEANFFIIHNRPDAMLTVKVEVFDINGALVWTNTTSGRADMYASSPVNWNLTDSGGNRVSHGIYIYRATVSETEGSGATATSTKRIAVSPM
ncbi:MAG: type IX secretion system sortase PorU [Duncaniella sp.]|nr:type IX secretion system sortase PorU [Duncaniella sp.]